MRMWMVPPGKMCRKHRLGERVEIHMAVTTLRLGKSVDGFLERPLELKSLRSRHDQLVQEMLRRGYRHNSPLGRVPRRHEGKVNRRANLLELARRCPDCKALSN